MPTLASKWLTRQRGTPSALRGTGSISPTPHITVGRVSPKPTHIPQRLGTALKEDCIPGYTGYMANMMAGTATLQGTYENCRKHAASMAQRAPGESRSPSRFGSSFIEKRVIPLSANEMYPNAPNPRKKTNVNNKSHISLGDDRDIQFKTINSMYYIPHAAICDPGTGEHDTSKMSKRERRSFYQGSLSRVGELGARAVEDAMKSKLTQRTVGGPGSLRSAFKYFDRDGSGTIDLHEFFKVLEFMGLTFSEDQVIALFGTYDEDDLGALDYHTFIQSVMSEDTHKPNEFQSQAMAERAVKRVRPPVMKIGQDPYKVARMDVKRVFDSYDYDKSNSIDKKELAAMLYAAGVKGLTEDDITSILHTLDSNKSGVIDFDEFWDWFRSADNKKTSKLLKQRY